MLYADAMAYGRHYVKDWTPKTLTTEALSSNKEKKVVMNVPPSKVYLVSHFLHNAANVCVHCSFYCAVTASFCYQVLSLPLNTLLGSVTALSAVSASLWEVQNVFTWQVSQSLHGST